MNARRYTPGEDILDSRDLEARIEELEGTEPREEEEEEELSALLAFRDEVGSSEWPHGMTLICDSYFAEYAQELAEDIGAVPKDLSWPACHIDWEAATDALKIDYSYAELGGFQYWYRT